jgi:endogenous inhibitor of DNA gyrase (YacG/DUF329 family)
MRKISNCGRCGKEIQYNDTQRHGKWCSNKCQMDNQYETYIKRWLAGEVNGGNGYEISTHIRRHLHEKFQSKCSNCGWGEMNQKSGKVPLHIDHIDGNSTNHSPQNLRLICPNCHSLTETYGSLNKNGRYKRVAKPHPKYNQQSLGAIG